VLKIAKGAGIHTTCRHLTKKLSGSIGNTTLHSLPGLYLLASSNAFSMLSASNATLNLAALLLTSIEIFIILFFFRIYPLRSSVWLGVKQAPLPDGHPLVGHLAIFFGLNTELTSEKPDLRNFAVLGFSEVHFRQAGLFMSPRIFMHHHNICTCVDSLTRRAWP
jgi:hypothetical protein